MSRKKNTYNVEYIAKTAFRLFTKDGYSKTTYKNIAEASGNERTIVQLYYPKKELIIINFLNRILDLSIKYINVFQPALENKFIKLYCIGQIYFSFLLKYQDLTLEVIEDRSITEKILFLNEDWTYNYLDIEPSFKSKELTEDIIMSMGGAYELIYRNILKGELVNVPRLLNKVIVSFMSSLGYDRKKAELLLTPYEMADEIFSEIVTQIEKELLY